MPVARGPLEIPFVGLGRQHEQLRGELEDAFRRVLAADAFILGEEVEAFEQEFGAFCGAEHCVGVASGTAALALALQAAGIGRGDEVIVPAHTFIASALAAIHAGATPVFCDVRDDTGLIDVEAARAAVTPRTAAIVGVHLYGQTCDMTGLAALAAAERVFLLEDAAHAHGAEYRGRRAGSFGAGAAFSFYPSKNLGALGDGGAVCTNDEGIAERVRRLRNLGQRRKGDHVLIGGNERLDALQAALLTVKLPRLSAANAARRVHAARYAASLAGRVALLEEHADSPCVYHLFPIRVPERDALARELARVDVEVGIHYHPALHQQAVLGDIAVARVPLARAAAWAAEELSLPMSPGLRADEIDRVADAVVALTDGLPPSVESRSL